MVYVDETGWKVGTQSCYCWVFSTAMHVLFRCGVSRGKEEAETVLGEEFSGRGVSDDDSACRTLFSDHQLRWAHLLSGENRAGTKTRLHLRKILIICL